MTTFTSLDFMPGLGAPGPDPAIGSAAELFAPLIGDWKIRTMLMPLGAPQVEYAGFWSLRWGLGGRAVYDVIAYRPLDSPDDAPYRSGITVRFYDLELATWRQVWIGAWSGVVIEFVARAEGKRIVIDGHHSTTKRYRWTFEDISATRFWWEGRTSQDGGITWRLEQTIEGQRSADGLHS